MPNPLSPVNGRVDLHFHTEQSGDAYMPIYAIIPMAVRLGLRAVAKADHDTLDGIKELVEAARNSEVEYIPAVELSTVGQQGETWHILAYWIDYENPELRATCEREKAYGRIKLRAQMKAWIDNGGPACSRRAGIAVASPALSDIEAFLKSVQSLRPNGEISLKQVFDFMVGLDLFRNEADARADFDQRAVGFRAPAHTPPPHTTIIDLIHRCGGVAVAAHPPRTRQDAVEQMIQAGLDGIECHNVKVHKPEDQAAWRAFCAERKLAYTGGTDWHQQVEYWNVHRHTVAGPDALESLRSAYQKRHGRKP